MTTQIKRQELYLDSEHPNYAELTQSGLSDRDTCEFILTSDGKAIAFNFDSMDDFMGYLSKLQGSRIECKFDSSGQIGWKYTDQYCIDNRPDGDGWVKFEITTYADILSKEIPHKTAHGEADLLYTTAELVEYAYNYRKQDVFFRFGKHGFEICESDRNLMALDGTYMGIVFNLSDVKP